MNNKSKEVLDEQKLHQFPLGFYFIFIRTYNFRQHCLTALESLDNVMCEAPCGDAVET